MNGLAHVDLTQLGTASMNSTNSPADASQTRKRRRRDDNGTENATKRTRVIDITEDNDEVAHTIIDLSQDIDDDPVSTARRKSLIKLQQAAEDDSQPKSFGKMTCIICLDNFTNVTATACGHIFCHECLTQALKAGEKQSDRRTGACPMCRKTLRRTTKGHVIPLAFLTKKKFDAMQKEATKA